MLASCPPSRNGRVRKPATPPDPDAAIAAVVAWVVGILDWSELVQDAFERDPLVREVMNDEDRRKAAVAMDQLWSALSMVRPKALTCPASRPRVS